MPAPPASDRYAVLGNPVAHSSSPFIHAAFARQTGEDLTYVRVLCALDGFEAALQQFRREGGKGCNVTLPFKFEALRLAARATPRAALAGAANTLRLDSEGWFADNTDGAGLLRDIEQGAGFPVAGRRVLLVGAGGAASGVLGPLLQARPVCVRVANRSADKALALVARHAAEARAHDVDLAAVPLERPGEGHALIVNASASSLHGAPVPLPASALGAGALVVDLMYGPAAEPFLSWARGAGAQARDGLGMLVEQAAEAFALWRGVRPHTTPVLRALREHLGAKT